MHDTVPATACGRRYVDFPMTLEHTLKKLASYKTTTGNKTEVLKAYDWIKDELQPIPTYIREYDVHDHLTLVVTPGRSKHVTLWLAAHIDVVPGEDALFTPQKRGNRLYARGVYDMKFAVASYVELLKEFGTELVAYDVGVMLTSDEEWGGHYGVQHLLGREGFRGDVAFLPDGTGVWMFEEQAKGKWLVEVSTTGKAAHGAHPWLGRSANDELCSFLHDMVQGFAHMATPRTVDHWHATVNVGRVKGGTVANVVAPHAHALLDIRYVSKAERVRIRRLFSTLTKKYPHTRAHTMQDDAPYGIARHNKYAKLWQDIAHERYGVHCGWSRAHGASDARFFNEHGIPTILISPRGGGAHGDREWVDLKDLQRYHEVLRSFVEAVARR